jgi:formate dehydrogenase (coenzyme F420) beta subunit
MSQLTREIREAARKLLREGEVQVIIGFEGGSLPARSRPVFVRKEEDVERLIWDEFCETNLARYLPKRKERTAIVAKGCDSRAIVELVKENQVARDTVVIIGVPCEGMLDRATSLRYQRCETCSHRNPVLYDLLLGQPASEGQDSFSDVEAFETLDQSERWAYLSAETGKCIRCYACRDACPLCYCPECFVDGSQPQWVGKSIAFSDTMVFHLMRAFHLAGRCVSCGACERACPMGVDIAKLNRKLEKDVKLLFKHEAGVSLDEVSPLASFRLDDPGPQMVEP